MKLLETTVEENTGIGFRELKRKTGMATGTLQYYIDKSEKVERKRGAILRIGICRSCALRDICRDKCRHKTLRKPVKREIVKGISRGEKQVEMAERLDLDRSTVNYHISDLKEKEILESCSEIAEGVESVI